MRLLKYFAILALVSVPLMLLEKGKVRELETSVDSDEIFERDLRTD